MALILKPMLKRASEGRYAASVQIDDGDGHSLGFVGPSLHASEADARSTLKRELEEHVAGIDAVIQVDGKHFGHDTALALAQLVVADATAPSDEPAQDAESGTWPLAPSIRTG